MGTGILRWLLALTAFFLAAGCVVPEISGGPVHPAHLIDGVYEGSARGGPVRVAATVEVRDHRIADIRLVRHRDLRGYAAEVISDRIVHEQSTRVDAVSGATMSSIVIMNAVDDAPSERPLNNFPL